MTVKDRLHQAIDQLPDDSLTSESAGALLAELRALRVGLGVHPDPRRAVEATAALKGLQDRLHAGWDDRVDALLAQEGEPLGAAQVAVLLGVPMADIRARTERGNLLAVEQRDQVVYPSWQFTPDGTLLGLEEVLAELRVSGPEAVDWFLSADPRLQGRRPLEALRDGEARAVARAAAGYGETGGA